MARSTLKQLFVSQEDHNENNEGIVGGIDSMEAACLDVEEAYQEVASVEQDAAELEDIAGGLESIVESLEAATENGGLDPTAAQFMHHAVDAHTARVGLSSEEFLPGLESFGGDSGRQSSSTISMESVKDTLKKIYNAIKAAVEKAIKAVTDFFAKIFGGVEKLQRRVDDLKKEVKEIGDKNKTQKNKAKVKVGSANSVMYAGKVDANALKEGFNNLVMVNDTVFGDLVEESAKFYNKLSSEITDLKDEDNDDKVEKARKDVIEASDQIIKAVSKEQSLVIPGDKTVVTSKKDEDEEEVKKVSLDNAKGHKSFSGSNEIDALSAADMNSLLEQADKVIKHIKDSKAGVEDVKKARNNAIDAAKKVADAREGTIGKVWTKAKAQGLMRWTTNDQLKVATQLASHDFSVLRSMLSVVESSTKQFEEPKDDS